MRTTQMIVRSALLSLLLFIGALTAASGSDQPSEDVATLSRQVVELYQAGKYAEATKIAERVLAIRQKALGPDHADVGESLNNLALLYANQGRFAEAEPLHERALAIREKALGPDHSDVAQSVNNMALLFANQGRFAEAEPLYKRALAIWEKALGPEHPLVANSLNNLAVLYRAQER